VVIVCSLIGALIILKDTPLVEYLSCAQRNCIWGNHTTHYQASIAHLSAELCGVLIQALMPGG